MKIVDRHSSEISKSVFSLTLCAMVFALSFPAEA
jgi:hypothetical protein